MAHQAPLSMGFPRQEYCSGVPFPSPGDLPNSGIEPTSSARQEDSSPSEPPGKSIKLMGRNKAVWGAANSGPGAQAGFPEKGNLSWVLRNWLEFSSSCQVSPHTHTSLSTRENLHVLSVRSGHSRSCAFVWSWAL